MKDSLEMSKQHNLILLDLLSILDANTDFFATYLIQRVTIPKVKVEKSSDQNLKVDRFLRFETCP